MTTPIATVLAVLVLLLSLTLGVPAPLAVVAAALVVLGARGGRRAR